ncbi:D-serine ammonia-lyase [Salinithrix halophila]|uniref:Probable D-serine dehydratase n=1 Tax=Salinithrix halophila TaxID=1485204 RepID=A0ABV8JBJ2_9BACL
MESKKQVAGKTFDGWMSEFPILTDIVSTKAVFWTNPHYKPFEHAVPSLSEADIADAEARLKRFAPYIAEAFPETKEVGGIIESPLVPIPQMQEELERQFGGAIPGRMLLKCDSHLPVSGSIKARGGIYEVLAHAEELAMQHGMLSVHNDYTVLHSDRFRQFFSNYSIVVGSTGNLGLSIGIISAKLGFSVTVHMSADAQQWKKDLLRSKGVSVVEHATDYSKAVEEGRKQAEADPTCYFIDDENSKRLFLGYAVAAFRLKGQLERLEIPVDQDHPLFVYLPCGVGGGPGGIAFSLKQIYKEHVHCFFSEPTHSPSMLLGLLTGLHDQVSVQDFGIDNKTSADGLAVGRPSRFVGKIIEPLLSGTFTVDDETLYTLLYTLSKKENIELEPSALAGMPGPYRLLHSNAGVSYLKEHGLIDKLGNSTHMVWATGGSMVPEPIMSEYMAKGSGSNG